MRGQRSMMFDVGLAVCGCLVALPAVPWLWRFGDPYAWGSLPPLIGTFVVCYLLARAVDQLANWLEAEVGRVARLSGSFAHRPRNSRLAEGEDR